MDETTQKRSFKPGTLQHLSFKALVPNMITVLALAAGATGIRFALIGKFEEAMLAIVAAAIFDALDGGVARMLNTTSKFGAELDSLSDVISFGVAPALILYMWILNDLGGFGWILTLLFMASCALRLARFNSKLEDDEEPRRKLGFLTGLPAPVGAMLGLLPIMIAIEAYPAIANPELIGAYTALVCLGMVSKLPTYSYKSIKVRRDYMLWLLVLLVLMAGLVPTYGWWTLIIPEIMYIISIPVGAYRFYTLYKTE